MRAPKSSQQHHLLAASITIAPTIMLLLLLTSLVRPTSGAFYDDLSESERSSRLSSYKSSLTARREAVTPTSTSTLSSSPSSSSDLDSVAVTATANTTSVFTSTNNGIGSTPLERHALSARTARTLIAAARNNATALGAAENIAIVDLSGFLLAFERQDNAFLGGVDIAIKKARGAVLFNGIATSELYAGNLASGGLVGIQETNGGLAFYPGGMALYKDGFLQGAVGCSGGSVAQDVLIAQAAVDRLARLASED